MAEGDTIMKYGIHPFGEVDGVYCWRFDSLEKAKAQAQELSEKHHVEIMVFEIIGFFKPQSKWSEP